MNGELSKNHDEDMDVEKIENVINTGILKKPQNKFNSGSIISTTSSVKRKRSNSLNKKDLVNSEQNHLENEYVSTASQSNLLQTSSEIKMTLQVDNEINYSTQIINNSSNQIKKENNTMNKNKKSTGSSNLINGSGSSLDFVRTKNKKKHKDKSRREEKRRLKDESLPDTNVADPTAYQEFKERKSKRKRKRKNRFDEDPSLISDLMRSNNEQPRIKIKFKAIPQPGGGGTSAAPVIFYVPTNEINSFGSQDRKNSDPTINTSIASSEPINSILLTKKISSPLSNNHFFVDNKSTNEVCCVCKESGFPHNSVK